MLRITPQLNADAAKSYQSEHLSKGDYYLGESQNQGHWYGQGSELIGLKIGSIIAKKDYDLLCDNLRPYTGERWTMRTKQNRRVAYDFTFSVPKDISVLAYTTGDQRIIDVFHESCRYTMLEVEKDTCVRYRKGGADEDLPSGNLLVAEFRHDTSRPVGLGVPDPHLHAHYVVFNASLDPKEKRFKAVQFGELKRDGPYYQELQINYFCTALREMGYRTVSTRNGFYRLEGVTETVAKAFSKRSALIEAEIAGRGLAKGSKLAKEVTLRTRQKKIKGLTRQELIGHWQAALKPEDWKALQKIRSRATAPLKKEGITSKEAFHDAVEHCFERRSVVRDKELLQAALKLGRSEVQLDELKEALHQRESTGDLLREGKELTTLETLKMERQFIEWAGRERGRHGLLGKTSYPLPSTFSSDQMTAVRQVLENKDGVVAIEGDAGAGKTTVLKEIVRGIQGTGVFACAPSAGATAVLREKLIPQADTIQQVLVNPKLQASLRGQVLIVDEAGLLSSRQMRDLFLLARDNDNRLILVGDSKQHTSVETGDAFRALVRYGKIKTVRLYEIHRQKDPALKEAVRELAKGNVLRSLDKFARRGAIMEIADSRALLERAAEDYVQTVESGKSCLVISPVWSEIHSFSDVVREKLRGAGQLHPEQREIETIRPYNWSAVESRDIRNYSAGDAITFHRKLSNFSKQETVKVLQREGKALRVEREDGHQVLFQPQEGKGVKDLAFTVGEVEKIDIALGEKLLIRANCKEADLTNGQIVSVKAIAADGSIQLTEGGSIPKTFRQFTYGYATTSHSSQGKTVDRGILIMGEAGIRAGDLRQAYVSNSRFEHSQKIYTTDLNAAREAMSRDRERKLAMELVQRGKKAWHLAAKLLRQSADIVLRRRRRLQESFRPSNRERIGPLWESGTKMSQ